VHRPGCVSGVCEGNVGVASRRYSAPMALRPQRGCSLVVVGALEASFSPMSLNEAWPSTATLLLFARRVCSCDDYKGTSTAEHALAVRHSVQCSVLRPAVERAPFKVHGSTGQARRRLRNQDGDGVGRQRVEQEGKEPVPGEMRWGSPARREGSVGSSSGSTDQSKKSRCARGTALALNYTLPYPRWALNGDWPRPAHPAAWSTVGPGRGVDDPYS
jgi:hypothetical protein